MNEPLPHSGCAPQELDLVTPSSDEMKKIFKLCRKDGWDSILQHLIDNPAVGVTLMTMDNHITTTITHQAITSKGEVLKRAKVVEQILATRPDAAKIKNGYGSLPLHVICQRNTKMTSRVKERLIFQLINAFPGALIEEGGTGKRTPLHIIFTDYINPRLIDLMIERGPKACFMRDKKGWLPVHVACSRHCSPDKLRMLLRVNPNSLYDHTYDGKSLLDLASTSATRSHPNFALIDELNSHLKESALGNAFPRDRVQRQQRCMLPAPQSKYFFDSYYPPVVQHLQEHHAFGSPPLSSREVSPAASSRESLEDSLSSNGESLRGRSGSNESAQWYPSEHEGGAGGQCKIVTPRGINRKRKAMNEGVATAYSLLMLSREHPPCSRRPRVSLEEEDSEQSQSYDGENHGTEQPWGNSIVGDHELPRENRTVDDHGRPVEVFKI